MDSSSDSDYEQELRDEFAQLERKIDHDRDSGGGNQREANIDAALALNDDVSDGFLRFEDMLTKRLAECRTKLESVRGKISKLAQPRSAERVACFRYSQCGFPYFRDKTGRTPPDNEDTLRMQREGIINYTLLRCGNGWSGKDKKCFQLILLNMSRQEKEQELEASLRALQRLPAEVRKPGAYERLQQQLLQVAHAPLADVALPIDADYDWDLISAKLFYRHTPGELRSMWRQYLHPQLCQSTFSRAEYCALEALTQRYNCQDWEAVARELGGRRSCYQCFVFYRTVMTAKFKGVKWTEEEDEFLRQMVELYRSGDYIPWSSIALCIENKSRMQIYNRYMNSARPQLRKGKFLPEEDAVIIACVEKYGLDFNKVAQFLPWRTLMQLRLRHSMSLGVSLSAQWTVEEDKRLLHLLEVNPSGENGANYAAAAKHFPGKNRSNIRMRYLTLVKWLKANPDAELERAPRRKARIILRAQKVDLATAVDNLAKRIERGVDEPTSAASKSEHTVDKQLISFFVNELMECNDAVDTPREVNGDTQSKDDIDNLRRVLLLLKANLDKAQFTRDTFCSKYIGLFGKDPDEKSFALLKTYSKKVAISEATPSASVVSVWGDTRSLTTVYMLPPNYDTITACKSIMLQVYNTNDRQQFSLLRNALLKANYIKFLERCEILFTWPLVMSCVQPKLEIGCASNIFHDKYDAKGEVTSAKDCGSHEIPAEFCVRLKGHHSGKRREDLDVTNVIDLPVSQVTADDTSLVVQEDMSGHIVGFLEVDKVVPDKGDSEVPVDKSSHPTLDKRKERKGSKKCESKLEPDTEEPPSKIVRRSLRKRLS